MRLADGVDAKTVGYRSGADVEDSRSIISMIRNIRNFVITCGNHTDVQAAKRRATAMNSGKSRYDFADTFMALAWAIGIQYTGASDQIIVLRAVVNLHLGLVLRYQAS